MRERRDEIESERRERERERERGSMRRRRRKNRERERERESSFFLDKEEMRSSLRHKREESAFSREFLDNSTMERACNGRYTMA